MRQVRRQQPLTTLVEDIALANLTKLALDKLGKQFQAVPTDVLDTIPADLGAIGKCWGVERVIERSLNVAGMVHRFDNGKSVVFLNEDDVPGRRRFSWAHELGHIVMADQSSPGISCRTSGQRDVALERSCDVIATEILMPQEQFGAFADKFGWNLRGARSSANAFQVTVQAATRRLVELMDEPALMSVWSVKPNQPLAKLKYSWSIPNQSAKKWKPQVHWQKGPDYMPPLYRAITETKVVSGYSRLLVRQHGESRYQWVHTEAMAVGRGAYRTITAIHYLSRTGR